jgi:hypothetical protein
VKSVVVMVVMYQWRYYGRGEEGGVGQGKSEVALYNIEEKKKASAHIQNIYENMRKKARRPKPPNDRKRLFGLCIDKGCGEGVT